MSKVNLRCIVLGHDRYTTTRLGGGRLLYECERCGQATVRRDDEPPFDT